MFKPRSFQPKLSINQSKQISVADLYPDLTPQEQAEAEFFLLRYLEVVRCIFERTRRKIDED